jgi:hypothetical protein
LAVRLSYSLPAHLPGGYAHAGDWLDSLLELGFAHVTFHPTYAVEDGVDPIVYTEGGPDVATAVGEARTRGFAVRLEPHLDWVSTLTGGPYEWRRRMYLHPSGVYLQQILRPLAELSPDELTLGSELDVSAYDMPDQWTAAAEAVRDCGCALGHKLNHDWRTATKSIRTEINAARRARGLRRRWCPLTGRRLRAYLETLDYVAVSFYPSGEWRLEEQFVVGEFGLGSADVSRPWHFDASTFDTPEALAIRRDYYLRFLRWLGERTGRAACFWTSGHFDVLGVMHPEWRDEAVVEAVKAYNYAVS